jgi:hypothetical protein
VITPSMRESGGALCGVITARRNSRMSLIP